MTQQPVSTTTTSKNEPPRVFSERLDEVLNAIGEGETPNYGIFCAYCYNPLPLGFDRCDYCGRDVATHPTVTNIPSEVIAMHQRKLKRESVIVNSFAYLGLAMGFAIFLGLVAINVLLLNKELWFFITATVIFMVVSRLLAGLFGGIIGDEIGFRQARKKLAEDWNAFVATRDGGPAAA
jgi:hypothetical protein